MHLQGACERCQVFDVSHEMGNFGAGVALGD